MVTFASTAPVLAAWTARYAVGKNYNIPFRTFAVFNGVDIAVNFLAMTILGRMGFHHSSCVIACRMAALYIATWASLSQRAPIYAFPAVTTGTAAAIIGCICVLFKINTSFFLL